MSATKGMVWVTSATGINARINPGSNRELIASKKAALKPASMPSNVSGRVSPSAASSRSCAKAEPLDKNRYSITP